MSNLNVEMIMANADTARSKIADCADLYHQLRPEIQQPFVDHLMNLLRDGATLAVGNIGDQICCLALFRIFGTTLGGDRLYIDDLVTDGDMRNRSYGAELLKEIETFARTRGCIMATLESGVQRSAAHRFYFRNGYSISAYGFEKEL